MVRWATCDSREGMGQGKGIAVLLLVCLGWVMPGTPLASASEQRELRPYLQFHLGHSFLVDQGGDPLTLDQIPNKQAQGGVVGVDWGDYLGAEVAFDFTDTDLAGPTGSVGELALWTALAQARLRYPLWDKRLTPYLLLGTGAGFAEFNDPSADATFTRVNGSDFSAIGAVGGGVEYAVADNIALGLEARHIFGFNAELDVGTRTQTLDLDLTYIQGTSRLYFGGAEAEHAARTRDPDRPRGYVVLRGGTAVLPQQDNGGQVGVADELTFAGSTAVGFQVNRYIGAELAGDFVETELVSPSRGKLAEYAIWTILAQMRLRYPLRQHRWVPYAVLGGGVGFGEVNDDNPSLSISGGGPESTPVGAIGIGMDYFLAGNLAATLEAKHILGFDPEITLGEQKELDLNPVFVTAGLRVLFP